MKSCTKGIRWTRTKTSVHAAKQQTLGAGFQRDGRRFRIEQKRSIWWNLKTKKKSLDLDCVCVSEPVQLK